MGHKTCRRCGAYKNASDFRSDARYSDGLTSWCRQCHRERNAEWVRDNPERQKNRVSEWRLKNPDLSREINRRHKHANKTALSVKFATWAAENRDKRRATDAARKAAKRQAIPSWANLAAIRAIYAKATQMQTATGTRMHVDHIVPLQHPLVCGLHCEENLRVITGAENEAKKNYWWPDMPSAGRIEEAYKQPRLFDEPERKAVQPSMFGGEAA